MSCNLAGCVFPPNHNPLVTLAAEPPSLCLALVKSPKSEALPKVEISTKSIMLLGTAPYLKQPPQTPLTLIAAALTPEPKPKIW